MINLARLVSTLLFVTACEKAPAKQPRLFTDDELTALETRVLAEVNKSTPDCIRPEALALWKPTGELAVCIKDCDVLDYGADHKKPIRRDELFRIATPEATALDAKCGALVSTAFERAAANPGCSPFQIGIDNVDGGPASMPRLLLLHLICRHADAQGDHASGARSLVAALQAFQDYARGRTNGSTLATASAARSSLAFGLIELLADAQLTHNDLDALATSLDHLIASEPPPHEMLQTESAHLGFAYGLVPLKGSSWPVPGGRSDLMLSSPQPSTSHDPRDAAGIMMLYALESGERLRTACQPTSSFRECFEHLNATPHTTAAAQVAASLDRPRNDDPATRARVKREIVGNYLASNAYAYWIATHAKDIVPLVALRLRIEILRNGRCPIPAELDVPPYSTLRAPSVLGDSVSVTPIDHALRVDPPAWVREQIEQDCKNRKPPFPPCPPSPKIVSLSCP
ncbi:MAG: hypothetical protein JWO36_627 [Myxococcales bacterium]|nr:hypothetical protein [Myxococcales bacterium]